MKIQIDSSSFITDDSRLCNLDTLFLSDKLSSKYIENAKANGCKEVITPDQLKSYFDTDIKIVGITGTNGKTTTASIIYSLLLDLGYKVAMQGTRGFFINGTRVEEKSLTTPMLLANYAHIDEAKKAGCEFFVTEVSSHAIDQERMAGLEFALKIHTNITSDHLDYHGTIEEYRRVKNSFFADESPKLVNKDDKEIVFNPKNARSYALDNAATYKIEAFSPNGGLSGVLGFADEKVTFYSNLMGLFNLYNILAAISAVKILTNKPLLEIADQLENFGGVSGRLEVISSDPTVIVDFAHTEDGIEKVLSSLFMQKMVVVFGAGGNRDKTKRPKMCKTVAKYAHKIIITSDNPRDEEPLAIIEDIKTGCQNHPQLMIIEDREMAIKKALEIQEKDEILVILGKGDETTQEIRGKFLPFSDKEVVLRLLKAENDS